MKMTVKVWVTGLALGAMASPANAIQSFIGGEAGWASYPRYTSQADQAAINGGFTSSATSQDKMGTALGIYGGQWLTENLGWETGYTDLGYVNGATIATAPPASSARINYKFSTTALYASLLGGTQLGKGTLYGKLGIYQASVKYEESVTNIFAATFTPISATDSGTGLLVGAGYSRPLQEHLTAKIDLSFYNKVKFHQVYQVTGTNSGNIYKLSVGMAYVF